MKISADAEPTPNPHRDPHKPPNFSETDCIFCASPKTNLCPTIRGTQGKGTMPDGTTRLKLTDDGTPIHHFMGCSTFSEYTVVSGRTSEVVG